MLSIDLYLQNRFMKDIDRCNYAVSTQQIFHAMHHVNCTKTQMRSYLV
jgi:hypothetical protein